ncbi:aspartate--tRNA ligase [Candidatus Woesearchaeota archaeon]|jgi:aspartyl-tRNA synthetase|nr:aspartate--tRNA ligase [Candidatus Woesearchaeota archaeon]MBT4367955.1 aspartate--tRNA ligase [Candidatus Woesearchaeota archaeon]MBT4712443.1 aspartate--tRNA ligase [Candidatus Woesearchaeota archaeon]MBT6639356.1 aspartate--tRNA ligase [Candidatus Woesearchaeota archaeon]MBT7133528.1 aspartate--tRNA ligase [Candidatus Woesearchaeota archaeon]
MRTHKNNELKKENIGDKVNLVGWVHTRRDHGGIIFVDLRDRYGLTQVVFDPEFNSTVMEAAESLRREFCIEIKGEVRARKEGMTNKKLPTGEVEVFADTLNIINKSAVPPIEVDDRVEAGEELRLKYRYLDLRRPLMQKRLLSRHKIISAARDFFNKNDFLEITTPMLVKSTPEGARDYVVPSRVNAGGFYALPQSPQLYKQILMISGCDRYYQTAICLRDEDLRADRQPEHMQLDLEMSFVTSDDIRNMVEKLFKHIFKEVLNKEITEFKVFSYKESMEKYGNDKPDIRFDLFLTEVTDIVIKSDFGVFKDIKAAGGIVKCINPQKELGRKEIDAYIDFCQKSGAKGMAWMRVTENGLESNIAKYFSEDVQKELIAKVGAKPGSILMFIADKEKKCNDILSRLRNKLAEDLELYNKDDFKFCWVKDFPLFAWNEEDKRWEPEHHMFSMPNPEFVDNFETCPEKVKGDLWDLVLNGTELGSGSIRVTNPEVQKRVMKFIGLSEEEAQTKFGFLLNAYNYGAPSHGGMGLGADRLIALMNGTNDIREVIAFPKNKAAECPMDESPSPIEDKQLKDLHIELDAVAKEALKKKETQEPSK